MKIKNLLMIFVIICLIIVIFNKHINLNNQLILGDTKNVVGDIDGDGKVTSTEYILIRRHLLNIKKLTETEQQRADINNDGKITAIDYILIKKIILYGSVNYAVTYVRLDQESFTLSAGESKKLTASISPSNATNQNVTWTSSDTTIATVDDRGLVSAKRDGNALITVKTIDGAKTATASVKVENGNIHLFGWDQQEANKKFGPILDGLFNGKTKEIVKNKNIGKNFNMHFPDMAYVSGKYYAYYITYATKTGKGGIGLAISSDGLNFENKGCVIEPDQDYDRNGAYFAGIWFENNTFYIVYESKGDENSKYGILENIALATSSDGINWSKKGVILYKNENVNWMKANVGTPDLYKTGNTWYLTFHGYDYEDCQIGVAYGTDLLHLTMKIEPIIPTVSNTLYSGTTGRRDVIYIDGWYYMVYEISTDSVNGFSNAKWSHQFARSRDMINWTSVSSPLLIRKNSDGSDAIGFGYDGPCWVIVGEHIYVYFRDLNNSTTRAELILE